MSSSKSTPTRRLLLVGLVVSGILGVMTRAGAFDRERSVDPGPVSPPTWDSDALASYDLSATPMGDQQPALELRWAMPKDCAEVYRIEVEDDMPERVARFYNRRPEQSESLMRLTRHERSSWGAGQGGEPIWRGSVHLQSPDAGVRALDSEEPAPLDVRREYYASPALLGPAAPDAACRQRSWDAVEDAFALGWPKLPAHAAERGTPWPGAAVEGRCNETACLNDDATAGVRAHERPCVTPPWTETLTDVLVIGDERFAIIDGYWQDRKDLTEIDGGVITHRRSLISLDHGRLARSEIQISHRWSEIDRHILIESVDSCPGSLASAGWQLPEALARAVERMNIATEGAAPPTSKPSGPEIRPVGSNSAPSRVEAEQG